MHLALAPMAGITDQVFRGLCFEMGCNLATTEMVSAQGYLTAPADRNAYRFLLARQASEGPLAVQIFGSDPVHMENAAARLSQLGLFSVVDINMGCPAQKVVGGQSGSALMKDIPLAAEIVRRCVKASSLPVTVKMRIGWDENSINAVEFAKAVTDAGATALTVHGRTRKQQYSGKANWEEIGKVRQAVSVPVTANGDIWDAASALECARITGCDSLAMGRGALGNPWLFQEIKAAFEGTKWHKPPFEDIMKTALRHGREMIAWKGEKSGMLEMRKHLGWYVTGQRGVAKLRTRLNLATSLSQVEDLLSTLLQKNPEE